MRLIQSLILLISVIGYGSIAQSDQTVSLGVIQSQYVTESSANSNSNSTSSFIPHFDGRGSFFRDTVRAEVDASSIVPMQENGEFYFWVPTLNIQFGDRLSKPTTGRKTQVTIGRSLKPWSRLDTEWGLGLWQPQFRWDYIRPQQMGLTGLFFETERRLLKFTAFLSGIHLPDQQANFEIENGEFVSENRWFRPPVSEVQIYNDKKDIHYELDKPSVSSVVFNPSYGLALRGGEESNGPWVQVAWANKPANQYHLGIETEGANDLNAKVITPVIHPKVIRHQLFTAEAGYQDSTTNLYVSVTKEEFEKSKFPEMWEETPLRDSVYYGVGVSQVTNVLGFKSMIYSGIVFKDYVGDDSNSGGLSEEMSSSIQKVAFEKLLNVGVRYPMHPKVYSKWSSDLKYTYSFSDRAEWVMAQLNFHPSKDWMFYVGGDVLGSPDQVATKDMSFISKYRDNDRIEGGFTHVF